MPEPSPDTAVDLTRTGDVRVFRGAAVAERSRRSPTPRLNQVGMAVVLEDPRHSPARGGTLQGPGGWLTRRLRRGTSAEPVYCAELVATTYTAMGLLDGRRPRDAYDPGNSWSGDDLQLLQGATLGPEIPVATAPRRTR